MLSQIPGSREFARRLLAEMSTAQGFADYPTAATAVIAFPVGSQAEIGWSSGRLMDFTSPGATGRASHPGRAAPGSGLVSRAGRHSSRQSVARRDRGEGVRRLGIVDATAKGVVLGKGVEHRRHPPAEPLRLQIRASARPNRPRARHRNGRA